MTSRWNAIASELSWRAALGRPESGAILAAVCVFVAFVIAAPNFLTSDIWASILVISSELGIVALGVTLLMIAGEYDLSVGSVFGLSATVVPIMMNHGWPTPLAIVLALIMCASIGVVHGVLVTFGNIPSLIVTLGALMFWRGIVIASTGGFPIPIENAGKFLQIFNANVNQFYVSSLWFLALILFFTFALLRTRLGNWIFSTGGNPFAALEVGVPVRRVKIMMFSLTSFLAGLGGLLQMARFNSVDALRGEGMELEAILAAVVGGSLLAGGLGSVVGTAMGVLMIGMMQQGLILAGVPSYWYRAGVGVLLIIAVFINKFITIRAEQ